MNPLATLGLLLTWSADLAFNVGNILDALASAALERVS